MEKGYLNLSVLEFLDVISESAKSKIYIVSWRGKEITGTFGDIRQMLSQYPANYDIWGDLGPIVNDIMDKPIHKFENLSLVDIACYVETYTNNYDPDRTNALYADVCRYYYNMPAVKNIISKVSTVSCNVTGIENVRYMKNLLASKINNPSDARLNKLSLSIENQIKLPDELNTQKAINCFNKALEGNFIEQVDNGFKWVDNSQARLAYFCQEIYCKDENGNDNQKQFPETALNKLFNVSRLGKARSQLANNKNGGKPQNSYDLDKLLNN